MKHIFIASLACTMLISLATFAKPIDQPAPDYCTPKVKEWMNDNIQGIQDIYEFFWPPICNVVGLFYDRLVNYKDYKVFYDNLSKNKPIYFINPDDGLYIVILKPGQKLTDLPPYAHMRGKTVEDIFGYSGDKRLMADIIGEATRQTLIVPSRVLHRQVHGRANVFYHEFGHLLHYTFLTPKEFNLLEDLYVQAKASSNFLDDHAAHNSTEYFAIGLEAYLSITKIGAHNKYWRHTRQDLKLKDRPLFDFIQKMIDSLKID